MKTAKEKFSNKMKLSALQEGGNNYARTARIPMMPSNDLLIVFISQVFNASVDLNMFQL